MLKRSRLSFSLFFVASCTLCACSESIRTSDITGHAGTTGSDLDAATSSTETSAGTSGPAAGDTAASVAPITGGGGTDAKTAGSGGAGQDAAGNAAGAGSGGASDQPAAHGGTGGQAAAGQTGSAGQSEAGHNAGSGGRAQGQSGAGAGGQTQAGQGGMSSMQNVGCRGITAAAHPAFAAIQRLATTHEEVRILVYGQSISEQVWWSQTKSWLEQTYPGGNLVMEEHALGGCSSQCLVGHEAYYMDNSKFNRLPADVFAWKPDLIIFHVYGDHIDYGYIMRAFSEGCAAFDDYESSEGTDIPAVHCTAEQRAMSAGYKKPEVLVQDDFVISDKQMDCPASPQPDQWDCFMNLRVIPSAVAQYGYVLQDNFHDFPNYIAAHHIDPKTLLMVDDTHLSEPAGTDVMFALTIPHLCSAR